MAVTPCKVTHRVWHGKLKPHSHPKMTALWFGIELVP